jgi:opacity protein-like surface antigen
MKKSAFLLLILFSGIFLIPAESPAQSSFLFSAEGRLGFFNMTNSGNSFDAVYGSSGVIFGGGVKVLHETGIFGKVNLDYLRKSGEKVYITDAGFEKTGVETNIRIVPLTFSTGIQFRMDKNLSPFVGAGIGAYFWSEEDDPRTDFGYHFMGGLDYALNKNFYLEGEFRWNFVPNAIGDRGVSAFFDENDLGGINLFFSLGYRFK